MHPLNRIIKFWTDLFPVWVVLITVVAYFFPGWFIPLKSHVSWYFGFTMLGIGATLNPDDLRAVIRTPLRIVFGTFVQYTVMPLSAFILVHAVGLRPEFALGLILAGSAPGAMSSNVMTYLVKGDVAYSISLTTFSTLIAPLMTPLLTLALAGHYMHVDTYGLFISIIMTVILPLIIGYSLRLAFKTKIIPMLRVFPAVSVAAIVVICGIVVALNQRFIGQATLVLFILIVILNAWGYLAGYGAGWIGRFTDQQKKTLSIEIGMQNAGLGVVLALRHFSELTALPSAIFCIWCIITTAFIVNIWNKYSISK
ncbi:MAG: bile acid:sodium symporter family protein [Elusimicrobia bacterium]|nr:bile acid:sodium symporter family protein [Elusimicrobiota bacterium]MBD3412700.1 bile acid:sodium symporter family protein [Elusimicrobiota bacterium]